MATFDRTHVVIPAAVTGAALLVYAWQSAKVAFARERLGVRAPATVGHPEFERLFRAHQNTGENLITFVPAYWGFVTFVSAPIGNWLGAFWVLARFIYGEAYHRYAPARAAPMFFTFVIHTTMLLATLGTVLYSLYSGARLPLLE